MDLHEVAHGISLKRKEYFNDIIEKTKLTFMELEILFYLNEYPENNTFTEVKKSKDYSKSHVSTSITNLIKKGYITREVSENNKKIHYLKLTNLSVPIIIEYKKNLEIFQNDAFKNISKQELENFYILLNRISTNLDKE